MKKFLSIVCISIFISFILVSCGDIKPAEFKRIESYNLKEFNLNGTEIEITAVINNPNNVGFKVKDVDLDILLSRKKMGKAKLKKAFKVSANCEKPYTFTIIVKPEGGGIQTGAVALGGMMGKGQAINLKGKVKVAKFGASKEVDVDVTQSLAR